MNRSAELKTFLGTMSEQISKLMRQKPNGYRYPNMEGMVATEGRAFSSESLNVEEKVELKKLLQVHLKHHRPKVRECFCNAYHLAKTAQRMGIPLQYAEGYGHNLIHTNHAWGSYHGKPIDLTWRDLGDEKHSVDAVLKRIEHNLANSGYVGFEVPLAYLEKLMLKHRVYASALDNYQDGWPLVRNGLKELTNPGGPGSKDTGMRRKA